MLRVGWQDHLDDVREEEFRMTVSRPHGVLRRKTDAVRSAPRSIRTSKLAAPGVLHTRFGRAADACDRPTVPNAKPYASSEWAPGLAMN